MMAADASSPPSGSDGAITLAEDSTLTLQPSDFGFSDAPDSPPDTFTRVRLTSLPSKGTLSVDGMPAAAGSYAELTPQPGLVWTPGPAGQWLGGLCSSADGMRLYAVARDTGNQSRLHYSADGGSTWSSRLATMGVEHLACSADGTKIISASWYTPLYTSADGGASWVSRGQPHNWTAVASSADGQKLFAAASQEAIYDSSDGGVTWTPRLSDFPWNNVICSADGRNVVATSYGGPVAFSADGGTTWTTGETRNWVSLAGSSDCRRLVAAVYSGPVLVSSDGGLSWTPVITEFGLWRRLRSSADGMIIYLEAAQSLMRVSTDGGSTWVFRSPDSLTSLPACSADGMKLLAIRNYVLSTSTPTVPVITYRPAAHESGSSYAAFDFQVHDSGTPGANLDLSPNTLTLHVTPVADAPEVAGQIPARAAAKGKPFTFQFSEDFFIDRDPGTVLTYSATLDGGAPLPGWLGFSPGTRTFSGTPGTGDGGALDVRLTASDGSSPPLTATTTFRINVAGEPAGQDGAVTLNEESAFTFQPGNFGFSDPLDSPAHLFTGIIVDTVPAAGALTLNGNPVTPGTFASFLPVPGISWMRRSSPQCYALAASADGTVIYGVSEGNSVCVSRNSGASWSTVLTVPFSGTFTYPGGMACSADGTKAVLTINGGRIYTTHDAGVTWSARDSIRQWNGVACSADGNRMIALDSGTESWAAAGWVYTSTNAGVTWTPRDWPPGNVQNRWNALTCSADGLKLAATIPAASVVSLGAMILSQDGGVTWTAGPSAGWSAVDSSADGRVLIAASPHQISVSTDFGLTWRTALSGSDWLSCSVSSDGRVMAACSSPGRIQVSVDGGETWHPSGSTGAWRSVIVSGDGRTLFASDGNGILSSTPSVPPLAYTPPVNAAGSPYASLSFRTVDAGPAGVNTDAVSRVLSLNVTNINDAPAAGAPLAPQFATPGLPFSYQIPAAAFSDADAGTVLMLSAALSGSTPLPAWLAFDPASRTLSGTPGAADAGVLSIIITANDGGAPPLTAQTDLRLIVQNSPPSGTDGSILTTEDTPYTFSAADFGFLDPADTPPNQFAQVFLTTLPSAGSLSVDGIPLLAGESVSMLPDARMKWTEGTTSANWTGLTATADGSSLIAVTGGFDGNSSQQGQVHVSPDWGQTWTIHSSSRYWTSIATSANGLRLAATALESGVFTSQDGGRTWGLRTSQFVGGYLSVASSADGNTLLALPKDSSQVILSRNGGSSWTFPLPDHTFGTWGNAAVSTDGRTLAALGGPGLMLSRDSGLTWTTHSFPPQFSFLAMSADGTTLIVGANGHPLHISTNAGRDWTTAETSRSWRHACVSADGRTIAAAAGPGRIYVSSDAGRTWRAKEVSRSWAAVACSGDGARMAAAEPQKKLYTSVAAVPELRFTPAANGAGAAYSSFTFQVADTGIGGTYKATVPNTMLIGVTPVNDAPVVAAIIPDRTATERAAFTYQIPANTFTDADPGTSLTLSASAGDGSPLPAWLTFNPATRTLQGTPGSTDTGFISVKVTATDEGVPPLSASTTFLLTVTNVEDPPAGTSSDITLDEDMRLDFVPARFGFTDPLDRVPGTFTRVKLGSLPERGVLRIDGQPAAAGDFVRLAPGIGVTWTARAGAQNWFTAASSADGTRLVAGVYGGRLYTSADSGTTWTARGTFNQWYALASSADGTRLAAAALNGYIFTSADSGLTWTQRAQVRNWRSIACSADGVKLAAAASGGQLYLSDDGGISWVARESVRNWYSVTSSADGSRLTALVQNGRIYTSSDSGVSWTPRDSDRNWRTVAGSADGTRLVAIVTNGGIYRSADAGETWQLTAPSRAWYGVCSSADGVRLGAVVQNGQLFLSSDGGQSWTARDSTRNWRSIVCSADGSLYAAVVPDSALYLSRPQPAQTLSFHPEPDSSGSPYSSFTFQVEDSGPAGANLDLSPDTVRLHVAAINDPPALDALGDIVLSPGSPTAHTVPLSGITAGPGEVQGITVSAASSHPLIIPDPVVSYSSPQTTGSLACSVMPGATGSATITVTVADTGGASFTRTFRVFSTLFSVWARDRNLPPDPAADGGIHLLHYGFGMDDPGPGFRPLRLDGAAVEPGMPFLSVTGQGAERRYHAVYGRRKDSSLSFTLEFSSDLAVWEASSAAPLLLAENADLLALSVPFPDSLVNGQVSRYFRVRVRQNQ